MKDFKNEALSAHEDKDGLACTVAIIGAGFSGTMAAIHIRRRLAPGQTVALIERSGAFGRGVAYADTGAAHLLNVRAANMSAFPDDPGHFERWLESVAYDRAEVHHTEAGIFTTRRLYGAYLQETLHAEMEGAGGAVHLLPEDAQKLTRAPGEWRISCRLGRVVRAGGVVLACGNLPAASPHDGTVFTNPWAPEAIAGLRPAEPVLIVGTGLTMVDLVLALRAQGFHGPIIALSRRGLLPHRHEAVRQAWPVPDFSPDQRATTCGLLRAIRVPQRAAQEQGIGWRAVIDSLRPVTASLWRGLPPEEQARFLRHLRPYWDIHRHRMAPPAATELGELRSDGSLRILRGRILNIRSEEGRAQVTIATHRAGQETLGVQRVIYATGLQETCGGGLAGGLLADGFARHGSCGLGLEVNEELAVPDIYGHYQRLWALGPLVRGMFWECVAVPDIRVQAMRLAQSVNASLAAGGEGVQPSLTPNAASSELR